MKAYNALLAIAAIAPSACFKPNTTGNTLAECRPLAGASAADRAPLTGSVFTIVMENKSRGQILGNKHAPYINSLASRYSVAEGYHDAYVHPSEANYLWMTAGQNFGVLDDDDPVHHHLASTSHIADQVERAGLTWKSYQQSMGAPCGLKSHGRYAAKHDPFVYFNDVNGWDGTAFHPEQRCAKHVVDETQLDVDIANHQVPNYVFITPDLDHDMHDGSIAEGDAFLSKEIPKIMATDAYKNGGVIFLLWDEGGGLPASDDPLFIAISDSAKQSYTSNVEFDTTSYVKTVQTILGLDTLPCAADRHTGSLAMEDLFTLPRGAGTLATIARDTATVAAKGAAPTAPIAVTTEAASAAAVKIAEPAAATAAATAAAAVHAPVATPH